MSPLSAGLTGATTTDGHVRVVGGRAEQADGGSSAGRFAARLQDALVGADTTSPGAGSGAPSVAGTAAPLDAAADAGWTGAGTIVAGAAAACTTAAGTTAPGPPLATATATVALAGSVLPAPVIAVPGGSDADAGPAGLPRAGARGPLRSLPVLAPTAGGRSERAAAGDASEPRDGSAGGSAAEPAATHPETTGRARVAADTHATAGVPTPGDDTVPGAVTGGTTTKGPIVPVPAATPTGSAATGSDASVPEPSLVRGRSTAADTDVRGLETVPAGSTSTTDAVVVPSPTALTATVPTTTVPTTTVPTAVVSTAVPAATVPAATVPTAAAPAAVPTAAVSTAAAPAAVPNAAVPTAAVSTGAPGSGAQPDGTAGVHAPVPSAPATVTPVAAPLAGGEFPPPAPAAAVLPGARQVGEPSAEGTPADGVGSTAAIPTAVAAHPPVAAVAAAPPTPPAPGHPQLHAQLGRALAGLRTAGEGRHQLTIAVRPHDLGPVTVQAMIENGVVRIELFAPTDAGRDAVRSALADLRRSLAETGLSADLDLSDRSAPHPGSETDRRTGDRDGGRQRPSDGSDRVGATGAGTAVPVAPPGGARPDRSPAHLDVLV
ncbi:hypothetical protein GCM10011512_29930 [Tersicoccus solisilvae]|uniref:Flagellar hook-length control protein-like C-terminal domain-containing protein n=1 Tax=Tersicoccus solisilvae TaxID=1882339 RepID=A0ABQ1PQJ8_9MICC|nr:flagellar hook-length control protein FliK [Tersicoccus solisilvae]GGD01039.1 hypothetical protein GCM10011512_29930 [Tersicoccus solisilvae]